MLGSSVEIEPVVQRLPADRAIHRAGVDVAEPEDVGDSAGNGTLAGPGRAVDRYDDRFHACQPVSLARASRTGTGLGFDLWYPLSATTPARRGASRAAVAGAASACTVAQIRRRGGERGRQRRRVARGPARQRHRQHRPRVEVDGLLLLVRQVRAPILHLRDLGVGLVRIHPLPIRSPSCAAADPAAPAVRASASRCPRRAPAPSETPRSSGQSSRRTIDRNAAFASSVVASTPTVCPLTSPAVASTPSTQVNTCPWVSRSSVAVFDYHIAGDDEADGRGSRARGSRGRRCSRSPLRPRHGAAHSRLEHDRHRGVVRGGVLVSGHQGRPAHGADAPGRRAGAVLPALEERAGTDAAAHPRHPLDGHQRAAPGGARRRTWRPAAIW